MNRFRRWLLRSPVVRPAPRTRLGVETLEQRVVLAPVAPGAAWTSGGTTVRNSGAGWLDVTGTAAAISVAPGTPTPWQDDDGNWHYPTDANAGHYGVTVTGMSAAGTTAWTGSATTLNVTTTGSVGPVNVGGSLYVYAGGDVGALAAHTVTAWAGGNLGAVTAADRVAKAAARGSVGAVTAPNGIDLVESQTDSVGAVRSSAGNILRVTAKLDTSEVVAGGWVGSVVAGRDAVGDVAAASDIGGSATRDVFTYYLAVGSGVSAGRDVLGSVTAGRHIAAVRAGARVLGDVTAPGDVWTVNGGGGGVWVPGSPSDPTYDWDTGLVLVPYVGGIAGSIRAGRDVHVVSTTGHLSGDVSAVRSVVSVAAGGSVSGTVEAGTDLGVAPPRPTDGWAPSGYWPYSSFVPSYPAYGFYGVSAGEDVTAAVSAGVDVRGVYAGRHVSAPITAGRDVVSVRAGKGWYDSEEGVWTTTAGAIGDVSAAVTAGRDVRLVSAARDVLGNVAAPRDVVRVDAGQNVSGSVSAGHAIAFVRAGSSILGDIDAATGSVGSLSDADSEVGRNASTGASNYSGGLHAGGDIAGSVTAALDVTAANAGGILSGSLDAGRDIGWVRAAGGLSGELAADRDVGRVWVGNYATVNTAPPGAYYTSLVWKGVTGSVPGDLSGTVDAGRDLYGIAATGDVAGAITAGAGIAGVTAGRDVGGSVTAGENVGSITTGDTGSTGGSYYYSSPGPVTGPGVVAGRDVSATISAAVDVSSVKAGRDLTGSVTASQDVKSARAGRHFSGSVYAGRDVLAASAGTLQSYIYNVGTLPEVVGNLAGTIDAARDVGSLTATGDVAADVTAGHAIGGVYAKGSVAGSLTAGTGNVGRVSDTPVGPLSVYPYPHSTEAATPEGIFAGVDLSATVSAGLDVVKVTARRDLSGSVSAARDVGVVAVGKAAQAGYYLYDGTYVPSVAAVGTLSGSIAAGRNAGTVNAAVDLTGTISAGAEVAAVTAGRDADVTISAGTGSVASVTVGGKLAGSISAGLDVKAVYATGDVSADVHAGRDVASIRAGAGWLYEGSWISASGAVADVTGNISAGRDVVLISAARDVSTDILAGNDVVRVASARDIVGSLEAGRDVQGVYAVRDLGSVTAGRSVGPAVAGRDILGSLTARLGNVGWLGAAVLTSRANTGLTSVPAGGVSAGRNITGSVRATQGGVASVLAGALMNGPDQGWLRGDVVAGKYDLLVTASGDVTGTVSAPGGVHVVAGSNLGGSVASADGKVVIISVFGVDATVTGLRGVQVTAGGTVAGTVTAGNDDHLADAMVSTTGSMTSSVTAASGVTVTASGSVSGPIKGLSEVRVTAGGDVTGTVTSTAGGVEVRSGGSVQAAVTGSSDVLVVATGDVSAAVTAGKVEDDVWGEADVTAGGNVSGTVSAAQGVHVFAGGNVSGNISTIINEALVTAVGNVTGTVTGDYAVVEGGDIMGTVTASLGIEARAHGVLSGNLISDGGDIWAQVAGAITGTVTADLEVYIEAGDNVSGDVTAGADGALANALVRSMAEVSGDVVATASSEVWAAGNISGDVRAGDGEAVAVTLGAVQGIVHSDVGRIRVWAAGGTGRASSSSTGDLGPDWMIAVVNGEGTSLRGVLIVRGDGPEVVAATNLDLPGSPDFLAADTVEDELGEKPRAVRPAAGGTPVGVPVATRTDWTAEEYLRRADYLSQWFQNMDPARAERWQQFTKTATLGEMWDVLKGLMESIDMTSRAPKFDELDAKLDRLIGPPPPIVPPPPVTGPAAKPGPTPEDLKRWENDAKEFLRASAAEADAKLKAADDDVERRNVHRRMLQSLANDLDSKSGLAWWIGLSGDYLNKARELRLKADQVMNVRDFDFTGPREGPVPRTAAGRAQAERDAAEITSLRGYTRMPVTEKLAEAFNRAMNAKDANGNHQLSEEMRKAIGEMIKPENLAVMGGIVGVAGVATMLGGPAVVTGIGVIGYLFTGQSVLEIGADMFLFISIASGARTSADFDRAAHHLIKGLTQGSTELVQNAAGATAAKVVARAAAAKVLAGEVAKGAVDPKAAAVQRADGRVEVKLPAEPPAQPPPPPGGGQVAAAGSGGPLAIVGLIYARWKGKTPAPPASLVDEAAKLRWTRLSETLSPDVIQAITKNVKDDGPKLAEALKNIEIVTENAKKWRGTKYKETLLNTDDLVAAELDVIFKNGPLKRLPAEDLIRDLAKISELNGFVSTLRRLKKTDDNVKGVIAEVQAAANDIRAGRNVEDINQSIAGTKSDIDLVSDGTLWQVKVGPTALGNSQKLKRWVDKALAGRGSKTRIGLKLDANANTMFQEPAFQKVWKEFKSQNPGVEFRVEIIDTPPVP